MVSVAKVHFSCRTFKKNNIFPTELLRQMYTFPTELCVFLKIIPIDTKAHIN